MLKEEEEEDIFELSDFVFLLLFFSELNDLLLSFFSLLFIFSSFILNFIFCDNLEVLKSSLNLTFSFFLIFNRRF